MAGERVWFITTEEDDAPWAWRVPSLAEEYERGVDYGYEHALREIDAAWFWSQVAQAAALALYTVEVDRAWLVRRGRMWVRQAEYAERLVLLRYLLGEDDDGDAVGG